MIRAALALLCLLLAACGGGPDPVEPASPGADPVGADPVPAVEPVEPVDLSLPSLEPDQYELHGNWRGERFWARLAPFAADYGGRVLQVVYTQPEADALGGTHLDPHPWLLLGEDLTLRAWLERSRLSKAEYRGDDQPPGYRMIHEIDRRVGDEVFTAERKARIAGAPGWDRRMAPLLLALVWQADTSGAVPVYDLFAEGGSADNLRWDGTTVTIGDETWTVQPDDDGRLQRLLDADRTPLLTVEQHLPLVPAAEAAARDRAFLEALGAR